MSATLALEQFLVFEITPACNLSPRHAQHCPSGSPERWTRVQKKKLLSDELIVAAAAEAYNELGFRGQVAWHYYCEPMLQWPRLKRLIPRIVAAAPPARFCLWTNGTRLPEHLDELRVFESIWLSNYQGIDTRAIEALGVDFHLLEGNLDNRTQGLLKPGPCACRRPFNEFIVDAYGNVRLCCIDWRGEVTIGNVWQEPLAALVERFVALRDTIARSPMPASAPTVCRVCAFRSPRPARLAPPIDAEGFDYARRL